MSPSVEIETWYCMTLGNEHPGRIVVYLSHPRLTVKVSSQCPFSTIREHYEIPDRRWPFFLLHHLPPLPRWEYKEKRVWWERVSLLLTPGRNRSRSHYVFMTERSATLANWSRPSPYIHLIYAISSRLTLILGNISSLSPCAFMP